MPTMYAVDLQMAVSIGLIQHMQAVAEESQLPLPRLMSQLPQLLPAECDYH